jgi:hypothetical protein
VLPYCQEWNGKRGGGKALCSVRVGGRVKWRVELLNRRISGHERADRVRLSYIYTDIMWYSPIYKKTRYVMCSVMCIV